LQHLPAQHVRFSPALPHAVPLTGWQVPVAGLHASHSGQFFGVPPVQTPVWHVSPVVHGLPSLQPVPFFVVSGTQVPVAGSQRRHWPQVTLTVP